MEEMYSRQTGEGIMLGKIDNYEILVLIYRITCYTFHCFEFEFKIYQQRLQKSKYVVASVVQCGLFFLTSYWHGAVFFMATSWEKVASHGGLDSLCLHCLVEGRQPY